MSRKRQKTATKADQISYDIPDTPMRFLWFATRPFWKRALIAVVFVTTAQVLSVYLPYVFKMLIDALTSAQDTEVLLDSFLRLGSLYVVLLACVFLCWRISGFVAMRWLAESRAYSFKRIHDHILLHSYTYFSNRFAGSIGNKIGHASDGTSELTDHMVWHYYPTVLSLTGTCILLFITDTRLGYIFLGLVIILVLVNARFVRSRRPKVMTYVASSSLLRGMSADLIGNIATVRQFGRRAFEQNRLQGFITDRTQKQIVRDTVRELGMSINNLLVVGAIALMMLVLYMGVRQGVVSAGDVVLVISLIWGTAGQLITIGNMLNGFIRVYSEIEEGLQETIITHDIVDGVGAKILNAPRGEITWSNVTFTYDTNTVFDSFNLKISPGARVGLVGSSGAGKTTFVSLLLRQHELSGGAITIDGQNIKEVTQDSLRENIAVVPQEPMLFHRSIRENIVYGKPDATDAEVIAVAKKAQAHEFIESLPHGYETLVGERGVKLSGGQKQRIAIARAMLKNAPILVLDEATSALDSESEVAIQKALHELMVGKTVIAIAHRLSTLREMDRIIVLEAGKIIEDGTHEELTQNGGLYARLWEHQAGGFLQD